MMLVALSKTIAMDQIQFVKATVDCIVATSNLVSVHPIQGIGASHQTQGGRVAPTSTLFVIHLRISVACACQRIEALRLPEVG